MSGLFPGDRVEVSSTHEVQIDGSKAWIGLKASSIVQEGETDTEAYRRVGKSVGAHLITEIERQASVVMDHNASQLRK